MSVPKIQDLTHLAPAHAPKRLTVLVVDDEAGFRDLLRWELSGLGIDVETADNGMQAIELARKTKFDVVITDISMPKMDGIKLLEEIKKIAPETEVIVATGFGAVETVVYAMKNGAFDFFLKPYDLERLVARIRQAADRRARCRECGRVNHDRRE
jgi:DNA-binding NtrC family response regulator